MIEIGIPGCASEHGVMMIVSIGEDLVAVQKQGATSTRDYRPKDLERAAPRLRLSEVLVQS